MDVVFFTGYYAEAATLIRDLRAANYTGQIMLSDAGTDPTLFTLISPAEAEGVYGLTLPLAQFEPRAKAWAARYKSAYGMEPGPFTMQAYDAVRLAQTPSGAPAPWTDGRASGDRLHHT